MEATGTARCGLCTPLSPSPWRSSGGQAACKCSSCSQSSWKGSGSCTAQPQPSSLAQHSHSPAQHAASKGPDTGAAHFPTLVTMEPGWRPLPGSRDPSKHASPMPPQQSECLRSAGMVCSSKAKGTRGKRPVSPVDLAPACFHRFLLPSPLLLPPLQAPFLTLPALCSAPPPSPAGPSLPHGEHPLSLPASRSQGPSHPISCTMHARGGQLRAPPLQVGTSACQGQRVTMGEPLRVCWGPRRTDHCPVWALTCLGAGWPHQTSSHPWLSAPLWS